MGSESPFTADPSTVTFMTFSISGNSNIVFNKMFDSVSHSNVDIKKFEDVITEQNNKFTKEMEG